MQAIILLVAVLLFVSSFSFLAVYVEDCMEKNNKEEFPLLNDEEFQSLWNLAGGNEVEFQRLAAFEQKAKQVETEYAFSLSMNPRAHYRMAKLFSQWGKEWDREHGVQD